MKRKLLAIGTAILALGMLLCACTKDGGIGIPAPKPVDEVIPDDDDDSGEGGGGEENQHAAELHKKPINKRKSSHMFNKCIY